MYMTAVMAEHNAKTVISICTARLNLIHQTLSANAACEAFHLLVGLGHDLEEVKSRALVHFHTGTR